jgi:hypothetical protein
VGLIFRLPKIKTKKIKINKNKAQNDKNKNSQLHVVNSLRKQNKKQALLPNKRG